MTFVEILLLVVALILLYVVWTHPAFRVDVKIILLIILVIAIILGVISMMGGEHRLHRLVF